MGIFQSILSALGFEQQDKFNQPQKQQNDVQQQTDISQKQYNTKNLVCYAPKSNADVKILVDSLKKNEPCIVNLGGLSDADIKSVLDFLGGAVYALGGSISRLQGELYVVSPSGVMVVSG